MKKKNCRGCKTRDGEIRTLKNEIQLLKQKLNIAQIEKNDLSSGNKFIQGKLGELKSKFSIATDLILYLHTLKLPEESPQNFMELINGKLSNK